MTKAVMKPTIENVISLKFSRNFRISPEGDKVAYIKSITNWKKNQYESLCFIHLIKEAKTIQLTRKGYANQIEWIGNDSLAILRNNPSIENSKSQIYLFEDLSGEPLQVTDHKNGVRNFKPYAKGVLYLANDSKRSAKKKRKDKFGSFVHFEQETSATALYYLDITKQKKFLEDSIKLAEDKSEKLVKPIIEISKLLKEPLTITGYSVSKQNDKIFLNCRIRDDYVYSLATSNYLIEIDPVKALQTFIDKELEKKDKKKENEDNKNDEDSNNNNDENQNSDEDEDFSYIGTITKVAFSQGYWFSAVSPEGNEVLVSHKERDNLMYTQNDLWILDIEKWKDILEKEEISEKLIKITDKLDRNPYFTKWATDGIFSIIFDRTKSAIVNISKSGKLKRLALEGYNPSFSGLDISENGHLSFVGFNKEEFLELFISIEPVSSPNLKLKRVTQFNEQLKKWDVGTIETISWKSKDGTEIDGVIRKPTNFDPSKKYPLVFIIHGGPQWANAENLLENDEARYYPGVQFIQKGFLTLKVNYRGSIGRGQEFLELNKDNLGIGDLWDIESAIDHLENEGYIDTTRIGCMGWSQGGYISAFVGLHSKRFKAVSVGAGISDWYTYHISNDIPKFTSDYLSISPFRDREIYEKTAPMSKIKEAQTPMLIQHGQLDQRVPLSNAKELYRGLKEMGVPVELFIYPMMSHPITKPKENRAIMHQNLTWFCHYLLGEDLDFQLEI